MEKGDRVEIKGYYSECVLSHIDEMTTSMTNETYWFVISVPYLLGQRKTNVDDTFRESDMRLVNQKQIQR